ncbi:alpha/beta-hydrolase [Cucurbitaria berberidis CBS 394.84]|uniref:Alpha/beta-hydrolase n=1 Tax=Cucurbitaria berberidis CBS 394.84 TaxID=1168544 RepID=A0A9P4GLV1_9PLEO|nr:alpha/beta-hydrolase [Cucurbitaria berberidis CBS 394.84]KAF1847711.1 alpha/beta-hydrolase [Cucurbitaria berberidis CBS 394.84]
MSSPDPTLVNIGTHSLALYAHGPEPSSSQDPVVLFVCGIASSSLVWAAVRRLLPALLRSYTYDRSGCGNSEASPLTPTAENIALELSLLIEKAPIKNPLIIVGHSWAGVLVREFIARTGNGAQIAGLVFVDANQETSLQVLNVLDENLAAMSAGVDWLSAQGLRAEHRLTPQEWDAFLRDEATEKFKVQADREEDEYEASFPTLRSKQLGKRQPPVLGDKPVYVIGGMRSRDWSGLYRAGVERGNGTEEQRKCAREMISSADEKSKGLMEGHLKLSTKGKLVFARESGHFVQLTQPDLVVDGVNWVLDEIQTSS